MFKIAIVVFREFLEIALLLGIIMAVTKPVKNSRTYIVLGALIGIVLAAIFALSIRTISTSFGSLGDEIFDSCVILLTAAIISWTVVWMQGYTKKIKKDLSKLSENITAGRASQLMLVLVVATAILREGAEVILFVYSVSSVESIQGTQYLIGIGIGAFFGLTVGVGLYLGLMKLAGKYVFKISTILLTMIAAGLAAEAAGILTSSGFIQLYSDQLWDTSWFVSNESIMGKILNVIMGYDSKPNGMQLVFYLTSILITVSLMKLRSIISHKTNA
jgi:high-affinity iron transporter